MNQVHHHAISSKPCKTYAKIVRVYFALVIERMIITDKTMDVQQHFTNSSHKEKCFLFLGFDF